MTTVLLQFSAFQEQKNLAGYITLPPGYWRTKMFELFTKWRAKPVTAVTGTVTGNPFGNINEDSNVTTVTSVTNKKQSAVPESDVKASHSDDAGNSPSSAAGAVTPVTS